MVRVDVNAEIYTISKGCASRMKSENNGKWVANNKETYYSYTSTASLGNLGLKHVPEEPEENPTEGEGAEEDNEGRVCLLNPFPHYNKSAADDFEHILSKNRKSL